jgi:hypothetical protein
MVFALKHSQSFFQIRAYTSSWQCTKQGNEDLGRRGQIKDENSNANQKSTQYTLGRNICPSRKKVEPQKFKKDCYPYVLIPVSGDEGGQDPDSQGSVKKADID